MPRYIEFRVKRNELYDLLRAVGAKHELMSADILSLRVVADGNETASMGYRVPFKLQRLNRETNKEFTRDGFVIIPFSMILSTVEYESEEERPTIGFSK